MWSLRAEEISLDFEGEIRNQIGRQYSLSEIREKLGLEVAPSGDSGVGAGDADAILDSILPPY